VYRAPGKERRERFYPGWQEKNKEEIPSTDAVGEKGPHSVRGERGRKFEGRGGLYKFSKREPRKKLFPSASQTPGSGRKAGETLQTPSELENEHRSLFLRKRRGEARNILEGEKRSAGFSFDSPPKKQKGVRRGTHGGKEGGNA